MDSKKEIIIFQLMKALEFKYKYITYSTCIIIFLITKYKNFVKLRTIFYIFYQFFIIRVYTTERNTITIQL